MQRLGAAGVVVGGVLKAALGFGVMTGAAVVYVGCLGVAVGVGLAGAYAAFVGTARAAGVDLEAWPACRR